MLRVKGWQKFQHYKDRRPPWIKLSRELLDNRKWFKLSDASRSLAIMLWLIASEHDDPSVTLSMDAETLQEVMSGETDGMQAFMAGQLRAEGDMMLATKLGELFGM